ncbi:MAG: hypothetical protein MZV64_22945 [Ignavibacteriales bacterium]|nr:hypothetical protein [Ignavibacteriales bacterium]
MPGLHAQHARHRALHLDHLADPAAGHADLAVLHHAPDDAQRLRLPRREHAPFFQLRDHDHPDPLFLRHHPRHHAQRRRAGPSCGPRPPALARPGDAHPGPERRPIQEEAD